MTILRLTGVMMLIVPVSFNAAFSMLGASFDYPGILRQPVDVILRRFRDGGRRLVALWYGFAFTALLFIPVSLLFAAAFPTFGALALASAIVGVLAGLVQAIGLLRWPFLVPVLAQAYTDPAASPVKRDAIAVVFEGFHTFIGMAIGEHLGYLFTAAWTILASLILLQTASFHPLLGIIGIASAFGVLSGILEPVGWKPAVTINAISYIVWSLWLVALGIGMIVA